MNLVGEISKRPDAFRVKAFDDDSKSEELEFKTGSSSRVCDKSGQAKDSWRKLDVAGQEPDEEEVEQ